MTDFLTPGQTFGRYSIIGEIGRGGMGIVFRARQEDLGRDIALKILPAHLAQQEEFAERFRREASLLASVDSPHIIAIYDHGEHDGRLFIATQLVRGGDLAQHLRENGPLTLEQGLDLVAQLAAALADAHEAGVLHRDVKPSNVLLRDTADGWHAYLCDFGIAHTGGSELTQAGVVVGTYGYLAPERCDGQPATESSDIYALGCVLVAALSGTAPYAGSDLKVAQQHISAPVPQWDPSFTGGAELNRIVQRSMAKHPEDRYTSAQDMRRDLLAALQAVRSPSGVLPVASPVAPERTVLRPDPPRGPSAVPEPASKRPPRGSRMAGMAALIGVFLVVLCTGGYLVLRPAADPTSASASASNHRSTATSEAPTPSSAPPSTRASVDAPTSPTTPPTPSEIPTRPALTFEQQDLGCNGEYVLVLTSGLTADSTLDMTKQAMQVYTPNAGYAGRSKPRYAPLDGLCPDIGSLKDTTTLRYYPYIGPFSTAREACQTRVDRAPDHSYVAQLSSTASTAIVCPCQLDTAQAPALSHTLGQNPGRTDRIWVSGLQTLLNLAGHNNSDLASLNPDNLRLGVYGPQTFGWVKTFQAYDGLPATGDMDTTTWEELVGYACQGGR